jgi:hypothetical protein
VADADFKACHFSVSCHTDDLAVLHCLRALAQHAEESSIPKAITWGGTKESHWERNNHVVTFRFTTPDYRRTFLAEAKRVLPVGSWKKTAENDKDPATRQRR